MGDTGGEESHVLTVAEMPAHNHGVYHHAGYHGGQVTGAHGGDTTTRVHGGITSTTGGGQPHNNMPPYVALLHCKKT